MPTLHDRATATIRKGKARITPEGYFVADALVAQANNIQEYHAYELGLTDRDPRDVVRVFRPESEVFHRDSLASASRLPITLDHPPANVDARNYTEYARGETGEEIMRDGQFMRVPIRVTDADAVDSVQHDRQEFSLGYSAEIVMDAGEYEGQAYDVSVKDIRYNHLAACRTARGGPELRITDERPAQPGATIMPKIVMVDSAPVDVANPDVAEQIVRNLLTARDSANDALETATTTIAARDATIAERDTEISTLRDQAKPLTPAQLRDAAREYSETRDLAGRLGVDVTDEMTVDAMRAAVVVANLGDKAKDYDAAANRVAFDTLAANLGDADDDNDPVRNAVRDGAVNVSDARKEFEDARAKRLARYENAHRERGTAQ